MTDLHLGIQLVGSQVGRMNQADIIWKQTCSDLKTRCVLVIHDDDNQAGRRVRPPWGGLCCATDRAVVSSIIRAVTSWSPSEPLECAWFILIMAPGAAAARIAWWYVLVIRIFVPVLLGTALLVPGHSYCAPQYLQVYFIAVNERRTQSNDES